MTDRFNAQTNNHELLCRGLPRLGEQVWCSAPQREEHVATVREYINNFTEVLVMWDWNSGAQWRNGPWVDVTFIRTLVSDDTHNLRELGRVNYSE